MENYDRSPPSPVFRCYIVPRKYTCIWLENQMADSMGARETFKTRGAPESVESGLGQRCASIPSCFRGLSERSQGWHATRKPEPEPHTIDKISQASYYSVWRALTARQDRECAPKIASLSLPIQNFVEIFRLVDFLLLGKKSRRSSLSMKSKETQRCLQKSFTATCPFFM